MILILAIIYLIAGFLAAILVFIRRPKIEVQIPNVYKRLEKEVKEWLRV